MLQLHLGICVCTPPPRTNVASLFGIKPTSSLLVFQIPVLHYNVNYGGVSGLPESGHPRIFATSPREFSRLPPAVKRPPSSVQQHVDDPSFRACLHPPIPLLLFRSFRFELSSTEPNDTPCCRKDCRESIYDFGSRFALQCRGSCTRRYRVVLLGFLRP
jgi:hypothetical protein